MAFLSLSAVTVMATGDGEGDSALASSSAEASSEDSSSNTTSEETSSEGDTSSEQDVSSNESSSEQSSEEDTSSKGTTSSKPSTKPGGSTFIDETGSNVSLPSQGGTEVEEGEDETLYTEDAEMGVEEEIEHHEGGKVVAMSSLVYRYIWIPILLAVLCVAALIYVNISFKAKFASGKRGARATAQRRCSSGAIRRNIK